MTNKEKDKRIETLQARVEVLGYVVALLTLFLAIQIATFFYLIDAHANLFKDIIGVISEMRTDINNLWGTVEANREDIEERISIVDRFSNKVSWSTAGIISYLSMTNPKINKTYIDSFFVLGNETYKENMTAFEKCTRSEDIPYFVFSLLTGHEQRVVGYSISMLNTTNLAYAGHYTVHEDYVSYIFYGCGRIFFNASTREVEFALEKQ